MSGSQSSLREANRALIVETVKRHGGLTQVELAAATGLSAATVSTIVKELLGGGFVDIQVTTRSGRRAQLVTLARRVGLAVGIQVGHRHLRVVLGDFTHEVVADQTLPLPTDHRSDTTLDRAALLVIELLERVGSSIDEVVGIGIGVPAPVDEGTGMLSVRGLMRGWDEVHIAHVMAKRLARPVYVDNDANLGALAESAVGAAREYRDYVYVRASYGTGAGIVINGNVHRGFAGTAGEIGHVPVDPQTSAGAAAAAAWTRSWGRGRSSNRCGQPDPARRGAARQRGRPGLRPGHPGRRLVDRCRRLRAGRGGQPAVHRGRRRLRRDRRGAAGSDAGRDPETGAAQPDRPARGRARRAG